MDSTRERHKHRLTDYQRLNNLERTNGTAHSKFYFHHKAYDHVERKKDNVGSNERKTKEGI